jgi:hypothetical protein
MKVFTIMLCGLLTGVTLARAQDYHQSNSDDHRAAQLAKLHELHDAFHGALSVRDPVNGDSEEVLNERIKDMMSLWTENGWLLVQTGGKTDGYYFGKGDPDDPGSCPPPSDSAAHRGTLCSFYKYVVPSFQPGKKLISLAPSYKTRFELDRDADTASFYVECHFFNVAIDSSTGKPSWAALSHAGLEGTVAKVKGTWLFLYFTIKPVGVPVP